MQYLIGVDLGTTATKAVLLMLVGWQKNLLKKFLNQF